jgi:hypothetical protein
MDSINKQLYDLYFPKWGAVSSALQEIANVDNPPEPTNPLLLYIDKEEEWINAEIRVMVFGQETRDWEDWPDKSIEHLCDVYNRFFNQNHGKNSHFWNGLNRFKSILNTKYPNKQIGYVWNNIIKVGKCNEAGRPPQSIYEVEREYFHVIPDEVKILNPNIILFLTGHHYDDVIRDNFGEITYSAIHPYEKNHLAKILIPEVDFTFRTYHPKYLYIHRNIDNYFNAIANEISF